MTRLLPLVAVLLPLLPLQGLGAIGAQGFDCEPVGVGSEDEAERGCTSDCCCGEVCPCAEAPPPEPPATPALPAERGQGETLELSPRMIVRTASTKLPEPREVGRLSHDLDVRAPALPWGRSVRVTLGVWTP